MPQPKSTIKPYQPARRTEEYVYRESEEDDAPLVMTIRQSLTHGEMDPIRIWFRSLSIDPDEGPDEDDDSKEAVKQRRRLVREQASRFRNEVSWPLVAPYVLGWNVVDANGDPLPTPAEAGGEAFINIPSAAYGDLLYHFLGIPQARVDAAAKVSGASGATDAPSPAISSPSDLETTP